MRIRLGARCAAILVAFALRWLVGILLAFRHAPGYTTRDRILQFFEPGSLSWALAILLALTLITIARKFDPRRPEDPASMSCCRPGCLWPGQPWWCQR